VHVRSDGVQVPCTENLLALKSRVGLLKISDAGVRYSARLPFNRMFRCVSLLGVSPCPTYVWHQENTSVAASRCFCKSPAISKGSHGMDSGDSDRLSICWQGRIQGARSRQSARVRRRILLAAPGGSAMP